MVLGLSLTLVDGDGGYKLPRAGGLLDQPADLMEVVLEVRGAVLEYQDKQRKKGRLNGK